MTSILYHARILNPQSDRRIQDVRDGGLLVDADGKIVAVGPYDVMRTCAPSARVKDYTHRTIIPGLIDTHIHLPQLDQRGKHGATLLQWLERYIFTAEQAFADPAVAESVGRRFLKKLMLNGTTTAAVYTTIHADSTERAFQLAAASGLRIIMGKVMMDQHAPRGLQEPTKRSLSQSEALCARWHGAAQGRLSYAFTPRFAPTCSSALWRETGKLVQQSGAFFQTHIAETLGENARVRKLFPRYNDYTALFEDHGCVGRRHLFAHAIHMSLSEYQRLARHECGIAHCPHSNFFLKSGRMPIELVEQAKVRFGLGTDVGAGPSMSMFAIMRHADYMQPAHAVHPRKALYLATMGGARALHMEKSIGNFAKGKWADFVVLDVQGVDPVYKQQDLSTDEILSLFMYRGDGQPVQATYVAGRHLDVDGF